MRIVKLLIESGELQLFRSLNGRMIFRKEGEGPILETKKGYEGELMFDSFIERVTNNGLILNDVLLEVNGTLFQIDSLHIFQETIYLFEIKNFEGDFYIENGHWYTRAGKEIKDPLIQVQRCESLFRQYLQQLRLPFNIKAYPVFVNPEFTLYQAPLSETIIFPSQLQQLIRNLNAIPSKVAEKQLRLANKILASHQTNSPYSRAPKYSFDQLNKGIIHLFSGMTVPVFKRGRVKR